MPRRPPSHELRERWMIAIAASFHPITVFRFARERAFEVNDLRNDLEWNIVKLEKIMDDCWSAAPLLTFWRGIFRTLGALDKEYLDILKCLADSEWIWWQQRDAIRRNQLRSRKESMIKHLAVYDWILVLLYRAYWSSFQDYRPWFLDFSNKLPIRTASGRRVSSDCIFDDSGVVTTDSDWIDQRMCFELAVSRWTRFLNQQLMSSMLDTQKHYNNGRVFEHYVRQLQRSNDEEKLDWEMDNIKWPYPDYSLKVEGLDVPDSRFNQRHAPLYGVPSWAEDLELRELSSHLFLPSTVHYANSD